MNSKIFIKINKQIVLLITISLVLLSIGGIAKVESAYITMYRLPYGSNYSGMVNWSGGPHKYGNLDTDAVFQGTGSGLDFEMNGQSFPVLEMTEGCSSYVGWGSIGYMVAI